MVLALTTRPAPRREARERIAYGELGVEQLGAVYETLLDYEPQLSRASTAAPVRHAGGAAAAARRGSAAAIGLDPPARSPPAPGRPSRRGIGRPKRDRNVLHPRIDRALSGAADAGAARARPPADEILALKVLDPSMGSAAFLVAASGFLAHAYEDALIRDGGCVAGDLGPQQRAEIRRLVAERCLFGVDLNPMAVQLARLSLWLASLAHGRPLSFLDHHLRCGDSVLGAWLSCLRRAPRRIVQRDPHRAVAARSGRSGGQRPARAAGAIFAGGPNDTAEQVRSKERQLAALEHPRSGLSKWKRVADLWCAQWFAGSQAPPASAFGALSDLLLGGASTMPAHTAAASSGTGRANRRGAGDSSTGSSSFPRSFSMRRASVCRTPALTPCSAIRHGT